MSLFISKALRRAEVFLEQVDESVAQASRRLVVNDATGDVDEDEDYSEEEDPSTTRRSSAILRAEHRARSSMSSLPAEDLEIPDQDSKSENEEPLPQAGELEQKVETNLNEVPEDDADGWGVDVEIDEALLATDDNVIAENDENLDETLMKDVGEQKDEDPQTKEAIATNANMKDNNILPSKKPAQSADLFTLPTDGTKVSQQTANAESIDARSHISQKSESSMTGPVPVSVEANEFILALKEENTELRKELEHLDDDFEKTRKEKGRLVKNLKRMKEIVNEMDESLRDKSAEARSLENELISTKHEVQSLLTKSLEADARGKDGMDNLRKELTKEIDSLEHELEETSNERESLKEENERLKEALEQGHEVDLATADGARRDASQAHKAYEAETQAHRETRKRAKEREEALEAEAALATSALGTAQRKTEECIQVTSEAKSAQRVAEAKLASVTSARDAAFARIEDLQESLRMYEHRDGLEAPGQREAKEMQETVSELENALEAKNVELNRLEGELQVLRASGRPRRDMLSPRSSHGVGRSESQPPEEVEIKLRHMADAALRKQAQLEVLRSENRALQHQLGMERKRTREAQAMAAAASSSRQTIRGGGFRGILDTGEDDRGDRTYGVRDGPLARFRVPRTWPRPFAKLLGGLDSFSAQALAFLRREPLLRIVILIYLLAIHIFIYSLLHWHVDVVTGSPESPHGSVASMKKIVKDS